MDIEKIRELRRAQPFRPFTLVLSDGQKLPVEVPYRLGISPRGTEMAYARADGPVFLRPGQVRELEDGASAESMGGVSA